MSLPPGTVIWVFGALSALLFAPGLFGGEVPIFRDLLVLVIPLREFARSAIGAGTLPLWTDDLFFGAPFLANYQSAVLYPPSAMIYALPLPIGLSLFLAFHLFVAGWGMTRYLQRQHGLETPSALFGGIVFAFGGFIVSLVPLTNQLEVAVWLPWVLCAGEELLSFGGWRSFFTLTVLIALQALGGAPEALLLTLLLLLVTSIGQSTGATRGATRLLMLGAGVALGLLLSAVQLVPTAEYAAATERLGGLDLERVAAESLPLRSLLQFLLPHVFYDGGPGFIPEGGVPLLWSLYVGIAPFALALPLLVSRRGGLWALLFWMSLVLSLGSSTAVFPTLFAIAPKIVGAFRYPPKFFFVAHFAIALLAARQLSRLLGDPRAGRSVAGVMVTIVLMGTAMGVTASVAPALALSVSGYSLPPDLGPAAQRLLAARVSLLALRGCALAVVGGGLVWQLERSRLRPVVVGIAFCTLTAVDLVGVHRPTVVFAPWHSLLDSARKQSHGLEPGERIFHYSTKEGRGRGLAPWSGGLRPGESVEQQASALASAMIPNLPMIFGFGAVSGSDGFATRDQRALFGVLAGLRHEQAIHLLQALGVTRLIGMDSMTVPQGTSFIASSPPWQYALPNSAPRTYFAERLIPATDVRSALQRAAALDFRPGRDAVTFGSATTVESELAAGEIRSFSARPGALSADLNMTDKGLWVLCDTWFPGWRATIDGQPTEVLRVNGLLRGIRLPSGDHRVEMRYEPVSFRLGFLVSAAAAVLFLACGTYALASRHLR